MNDDRNICPRCGKPYTGGLEQCHCPIKTRRDPPPLPKIEPPEPWPEPREKQACIDCKNVVEIFRKGSEKDLHIYELIAKQSKANIVLLCRKSAKKQFSPVWGLHLHMVQCELIRAHDDCEDFDLKTVK